MNPHRIDAYLLSALLHGSSNFGNSMVRKEILYIIKLLKGSKLWKAVVSTKGIRIGK